MTADFLVARCDLDVVLASLLIATFASYVTLDLANRVRTSDVAVARAWQIGGSLAMGTGIWSMHFVGMLAFSLPIEIGYDAFVTFVSWLAAVLASALALHIAARETLTLRTLCIGAAAIGAGICAMHYTGMAALQMAPGIVWNRWLVAASVAIACGASAVALLIFFGMRRLASYKARAAQCGAALVMGLAISGMHYTAMASAGFPADALCLSAGGLGGRALGTLVVAASTIMLTATLLTSILDARMQATAARLAASLQASNEQLRDANEELQRVAFRDALTGLPNRLLFDEQLRHAVARADRGAAGTKLAVLFIDLDGFKPVNDTLGHAGGDEVLLQVAARLRGATRQCDMLARLGGDEFVMLIEGAGSAADGVEVAARMLRALAAPLDVRDRQVALTCSIGIALYPDHAAGDKLIASADAAMYQAKRAGGSTCAVFEAGPDEDPADLLELLHELRLAVERNQLELHFQPQIDARSGAVHGVEVLLRWRHPQRGLMSPALFIPLAERFGLIVMLGNWVVEETCRQLAAWRDRGLVLQAAINLSVFQLRQGDVALRLRESVERHRIDAGRIVCEITESAAMEDTRTTQRVLEQLAALGLQLSIDDFGTGHSSLAYLRRLRAHELKIDRSFVRDVAASDDARAIVDAVVRLAHALGMRVVAEGVETAAQRSALIELGCDVLQGYWFARPMPADALLERCWPAAGSDRRPGFVVSTTALQTASSTAV